MYKPDLLYFSIPALSVQFEFNLFSEVIWYSESKENGNEKGATKEIGSNHKKYFIQRIHCRAAIYIQANWYFDLYECEKSGRDFPCE